MLIALYILLAPHAYFTVFFFAGGIDLELAPQVVTALDDICVLSPRCFDMTSLAALLGEVCLWLVEQRIGPRAQHARYRSCDPYAQVRYCSLIDGWFNKCSCWGIGIRCRTGEGHDHRRGFAFNDSPLYNT